jgi:hypothetical protein
MTYRGFMRAAIAAERRGVRLQQQRSRIEVRRQKLLAKIDELERAKLQVEEYEELLRHLTTAHHECSEVVNWAVIGEAPEPKSPLRIDTQERPAVVKLANYRPSLFVRLLGLEERRRKALSHAVLEGKAADERDFTRATKEFADKHAAWEASTKAARAVQGGDLEAYREAIHEGNPLACLTDLECTGEIDFPSPKLASVRLLAKDQSIAPHESKALMKSGKLNSKPLTEKRKYEIYISYICSCSLRAARELIALLPVSTVLVNVDVRLLNPATGLVDSQTILGVGYARETLATMAFDSVDPVEAITLFVSRSGLTKSTVRGVDPLQPDALPPALR